MFDPDWLQKIGRGVRTRAELREMLSAHPGAAGMYLESLLDNLVVKDGKDADPALAAIDCIAFLYREYEINDIMYEGERYGEEYTEGSDEVPGEDRDPSNGRLDEFDVVRALVESINPKDITSTWDQVRTELLETFSLRTFKLKLMFRLLRVVRSSEDLCLLHEASRLFSWTAELGFFCQKDAEVVDRQVKKIADEISDLFAEEELRVGAGYCLTSAEQDFFDIDDDED